MAELEAAALRAVEATAPLPQLKEEERAAKARLRQRSRRCARRAARARRGEQAHEAALQALQAELGARAATRARRCAGCRRRRACGRRTRALRGRLLQAADRGGGQGAEQEAELQLHAANLRTASGWRAACRRLDALNATLRARWSRRGRRTRRRGGA